MSEEGKETVSPREDVESKEEKAKQVDPDALSSSSEESEEEKVEEDKSDDKPEKTKPEEEKADGKSEEEKETEGEPTKGDEGEAEGEGEGEGEAEEETEGQDGEETKPRPSWGAVKVSQAAKERKAQDSLAQKRKSKVVPDIDPDDRMAGEIPDSQDQSVEYSLEDKILFYKERECLLLLLEARKLLASMIAKKEKQVSKRLREKREAEEAEKKKSGRLSVQEIQDMLQSQPDEDDCDMVSEIQELKKSLVIAVRQNHKLERDLAKLDKRIALLIKNRTSLQDVLAASKGLRSQKKRKEGDSETQMDPKKLEHYQDMFYLLQTEPRYLARCIYVINPQQLESFLDTVILTLFGDAFSPREEFLQLSLFQLAIQREISVIRNLGDFIGGQSETVLPKMINSYCKRKQGLEYLKTIFQPILSAFIKVEENLDMQPKQVYQAMINEHEIRTGTRSELPREIPDDQAAENPDVKRIISERSQLLEKTCQQIVDAIVRSLDDLPYGLRWLCKQLRSLCLAQMPDTTEEDISKVIVYFVFYRFMNSAIVQPDQTIIDDDIPGVARKNLVHVSKILQQVFNCRRFDPEKSTEKQYVPLNAFIERNEPTIKEYVCSVIQVGDPEDVLQVNKYMELAQKTKPVIIISLHEIFRTHILLRENIDELAPEKDDPLRIIMQDLGEAEQEISEDDDRELQLTLTNRFKVDMEEEAEHTRLYAETKELVIPILRMVPVQMSIHRLNLMDVLEAGIKYATETNNKHLQTQINKILENLGRLENAEVVTKDDNYESFVHDVALEVANRSTIREQQRKEVARLKSTLENLLKHQTYVDESIKSYQDYLQSCKENQYMVLAAKKKKGKGKKAAAPGYSIAPVKFTYGQLAKKGVIIDSEVPSLSRKKTTFLISSETPGVFDVVAKIAGVSVEKMQLDFDDLLERHYNNITKLELDQVTLDVNMTIHLINKSFLS